MAKDPAFLFYPNDWLGGTLGMTFEEKGAYMELLMMQFNRGHMTKHMIGQTVGQLWGQIEDKFIKDDKGLYFNKRLEEEQIKRRKYSESRRNNVKGNNQYTKKPKKVGGHMTSHMENVNEDENKDIIKDKYNKKELLEILKKQQQHFEGVGMRNKITNKQLWEKIDELVGKKMDGDNTHEITEDNAKEFKNHFGNWLPLQKEKGLNPTDKF